MSHRTSFLCVVGSAVLALAAVGCGSTEGPGQLMNGGVAPVQTGPTIDYAAVSAAAASYQTSSQFKRVSKIYASTKDPVNVAMWISADAAAQYLQINPDVMAPMGPGVNGPFFLPTGTIIVRAVYTDTTNFTNYGSPDALTILVKGPPGYDAPFGEWMFAVTDTSGNVLPTKAIFMDQPTNTTPLIGAVPGCHAGCHENQRGEVNDFLFGVEAKNQVTPM